MAFKPILNDDGKSVMCGCATGQTITKYCALADNGSGYLSTADSTTQNVTHVALETVTTTSNGQQVLCLDVQGVKFEADCDAAPAQTDVGTLADLASSTTINPDSSTNDVFFIEDIVNAEGKTTVVKGYFRQQSDV